MSKLSRIDFVRKGEDIFMSLLSRTDFVKKGENRF